MSRIEEIRAEESASIEEQVAEFRAQRQAEVDERVRNRLNQEIGEARQRVEQAQRDVAELEEARNVLSVG